MHRRTVVWLLVIPLAVIGSQAAHVLAYRLVTLDEDERAHALAISGHAYLAYLPLILAMCSALFLVGLAGELGRVVRDRERAVSRPSTWCFAALPLAIFSLQEHFERLAHDGAFPLDATLEPTFLVGLLLQIPFALAAYALARLLLNIVHALVDLLSVPSRGRRSGSSQRWRVVGSSLPRLPVLGLGYGSRGPPAMLAA